MKILVSGVPRSFGGIGTLIENMAACNAQQENPLSFSFLVPQGSPYAPHFEQQGYRVIPVPPLSRIRAYRRVLKEAFDRESYDAVWINNTSKVDMILPVLARKHGVKILYHSHGVDCEEQGLKRLFFQAVECLTRNKLFRMIDMPLACSKASADYFYKGYRHPERIILIKNGIRVERFRFRAEVRESVRMELKLGEGETAVCSCGRLSAVKNNQLLIRTMALLPPGFRLFLIGKGDEEQMLRSLAVECGVADRVCFLGFRTDVERLLNGMDIYAMPSLNEGMPFSLIEAQTNGLPCVVTENISREVALTDLVRFVSIDDAEKWASCIKTLPRNDCRVLGAEEVRRAGFGMEDSFSAFREQCLRAGK